MSTLEVAVGGGHASLARRALGSISDESEREAVLNVLATHAASGSRLAMELLVEGVDRFGVARRAARQFLVEDAAVAEVVQDTLVALVQAIGSFRGQPTFTAWLHELTREQSVDYRRRAHPGDAQAAAAAADAADPGPSERMSSLIASRPGVRRRLDQLPERYRDAVVLRDVERLPYPEVARRLGRNLETARSHVARGRALLADLVDEDARG